MAKKKLTHQSKQHEEEEAPHQPQNDVEKLQNLKNLNSLLLKETSERRQQVQSLTDANHTLESSLNRSAMQNQLLQSHLSDAADDNVVSELQNAVAFAFVKSQVTELGFLFASLVADKNNTEVIASVLKIEVDELNSMLEKERVRFSRVSEERDEMKRDFEGLVFESNGLKEKLLESENRERKLLEEVERLREEGFQKEREIREVMGERDFAVRNMRESAMVIEELKEEKNEILKVNDAQKVKIESMEFELTRVNEDLCDLQKQEGFMRGKILELEERIGLGLEKEEELMLEIKDLRKQKEEFEGSVEMLKGERDSVQKVLDVVQKELEEKTREIDETIRAKNEIEEAKVSCEAEIVELRREIVRLRDVVSEMNESCRGFEEKNRELVLEVEGYRNSVDEIVVERDNIRKGFNEEKNKVKSLMLQVAGMEDKIEEMADEMGLMRDEREKLLGNIGTMESRVEVLMNEKDALQRSLLEAQLECNDMRAKVEFSSINSNRVLEMLKSTAAELVCRFKEGAEEVKSNEQKHEEEIQLYAEQLHAIKDAFRSKDKMVADMKQQSEVLQNSVAQAHKMKSFWTVISSATSILAAALAAYVAKGR